MDDLPGWGNPAAVVLSCPGPLRRHAAALLPIGEATLPQVLLGAESQLLAFAAAAGALAGRLFFAPFPEMFPDAPSLRAAWRHIGGAPGTSAGGSRLVHLRFGGVRAARVLKGVRNGCVVAETGGSAPLTASHHPFASGTVLPAAIRRIFVYGGDVRVRSVDGSAVPSSRLPMACVTADLAAALPQDSMLAADGTSLDLVSLVDFRSHAWAAGPVRARGARVLVEEPAPSVLLPWNMDHPGSIVPDLLERLARLHGPRQRIGTVARMPRIILLPFNYIGQTGIIRQLILRLREAAHDPEALLSELFLARVSDLQSAGMLRRISSCAWVDGNDPEHWWTLARFAACGITPILIDPTDGAAPANGGRIAADESIWVEAETRCGTLTFPARLPSLRTLPGLLALTAGHAGEVAAVPARTRPRQRRIAGKSRPAPDPAAP